MSTEPSFDNINWPVLIRTFDVVMDDKTAVNVTTICVVRLWPANKETLESIERLINKVAKYKAKVRLSFPWLMLECLAIL